MGKMEETLAGTDVWTKPNGSQTEENKKEESVEIGNAKLKMLNIFLLGLCFCFVFTGFNTMGQTQVGRI